MELGKMGRGGFEPPTHGFSVLNSTYNSISRKDLYAVFSVKMRFSSG
jgi:hypothetical protein